MFKAPKYAERSVSFETRDFGDDGFTLEGYGAVFNQATVSIHMRAVLMK